MWRYLEEDKEHLDFTVQFPRFSQLNDKEERNEAIPVSSTICYLRVATENTVLFPNVTLSAPYTF